MLQASRFHALTAPGASLHTAQGEGRRLAGALVALTVVAAAVAVALQLAERRARIPRRARHALLVSVAALVVVGLAGLAVAAGGPVAIAERVTDSFSEPLPSGDGDLDRRLLSVSGNGRSEYWRVGWRMVGEEPLLGTGAGSYEAHWLRERPVAFHARDAHNLYLETLAELGPIGLALLLATLSVPFAALARARNAPFVPAAGGGFAAFLVHAGVDWDWEVPAVTVPAIFCAAALLSADRATATAPLTGGRRAVALALAAPILALALVAHVGNRAAAASADAAGRGEPERALARAQLAIRWAPWSDEAWQLRGEAELLLEDDAAARRSLRRALELNPESWSAWLDLAVVSRGQRRAQALERAIQLNPLSPEADQLRTQP